MTQKTEINQATPTENSNRVHWIELADGDIGEHGDTVIDIPSKTEGQLRYSLWAWLVDWEDEKQTIVYDPMLLKLKK